MSTVSFTFSPFTKIVNTPFSKPIRSTNPAVSTSSFDISNNWNFKEELPAFDSYYF